MAWDHMMANQKMPNTWLVFVHISKSLNFSEDHLCGQSHQNAHIPSLDVEYICCQLWIHNISSGGPCTNMFIWSLAGLKIKIQPQINYLTEMS